MRLWLLRHAEVAAPPGLCYGASDLPAQAPATERAAQAAAAALPAGLPVWVSGLQRAQQLAQALATRRPDLGPPRCDTRLNEMDFGQWEGRPWADIPRAAIDAWTADFAHHRMGGAESTQQVLDRVAAALTAARLQVGANGALLWVTHAGVIRAVMHLAQRGAAPIQHAHEWPQAGAAPGELLHVELQLVVPG